MNKKQQELYDLVKQGHREFKSVRTNRRGRKHRPPVGAGDIAVMKSLCSKSQVDILPPNVRRYPVLRIILKETINEEFYPTEDDVPGSVYQIITERYRVEIAE